jgi:hypothetical protein
MLWSYYYFEVTSPASGSFLAIQCTWRSYMLSRLYRKVKTFRSNLPTYLLIRKGWNSYWCSARRPYMVQWLQAHCTIANSPRVWQVSDSRSTHTIHAWRTRLLMARKWQYAFTWMTANWVTIAAELMITWLIGSGKNIKVSLRMDQDKWQSAEAESTSISEWFWSTLFTAKWTYQCSITSLQGRGRPPEAPTWKGCRVSQPGGQDNICPQMSQTTCTAIAFLMPRVWAPNKDDWNKLVHLMKYLRGTRTCKFE